ncbi:PucR family transcriptional regulator [Nonomuraea sp. KC401]|uniref:PucR family transcriptional regulator n=1 Tax=unclassified Nonomuraea TaxID=2593643 RepID=UPI0010FD9614|nr:MULTISPECIES: PucR family transcriptional regulator [unclassified Nonomuraea]NBE98955.1 PucR family transcriptional regulator [Nonomuraea sp. K271]TLF57920.1 PucR family transcriptional regulator [Nonomuraea sp. KC401]
MHNSADLQEIVDEIAARLGASATLEDRSFRLLAYGAQHGAIDTVRQESILRRRATGEVRDYFERYGIARAEGPVRIPADAELHVLARVCWPLRHREVTYGYLWLLDSGELDDTTLHAVAPLVARAAAALAQEARSRQDLGRGLRGLLSPDPEERAAAAIEVPGPVAAVAVRESHERVAALWTLPRGVLARAGSPVALLAPAHLAAEVAQTLQSAYGTAAGIGGTRGDPADAWLSWREARHALRIAEHFPRHAPLARWEDLGVHRLLARLGPSDLRELAAETAGLEGELAHTVEVYLDRGGHAQKTAAELGIHRQTLYYRLGKAERLVHKDLSDGDDRLAVHLGLKAARLRGQDAR